MDVKPTMTTGQRFWRMLRIDKREITYIYIYAIVAGVINLTLPLGVQAILNFVQGGAVSSSWWLLIIVVTLATFLAGVLVVMQMSVSETLQRRIFVRVSFDFAKRLPNLKTETIRREHVPELVNRFFDTLTIQKGLPKILIDLSTAAMQIVFGLLLLSFYHPLFIAFGAVLIIILGIIFRVTGPQGFKTSLKESKYKYEVAHWLEELGRTIHTFKLAGMSDLPLKKTDSYVSSYLDAKQSHFRILLTQFGSIVAFKTIVTFVLLSLGSYLVISNQINLGQFVAAEIVIILIMSSSEKLIVTMDTVYDVLTALEKIGAVADLPIEHEHGIDFSQVDTKGGVAISLQNVNHRFVDSREPILRNINLDIAAGEKVCIVGYNGSGKTTLVQIISCFLNDFQGAILYNNVPRKNFNQNSLRGIIGDYSSQEDIFKGTVRENIDLGYEHIQFEEVVKVCDEVGLTGFIQHLPNGYDTMLLPEGKNLPRNVVAKMILARSIVSKPKLLAIEELMANLEFKDRIRIASLLTDPKRMWTLVAVTDDPILASQCDRIIIMDDGQIIEQGSFEQIQKSVHFNKIFKVYTA